MPCIRMQMPCLPIDCQPSLRRNEAISPSFHRARPAFASLLPHPHHPITRITCISLRLGNTIQTIRIGTIDIQVYSRSFFIGLVSCSLKRIPHAMSGFFPDPSSSTQHKTERIVTALHDAEAGNRRSQDNRYLLLFLRSRNV